MPSISWLRDETYKPKNKIEEKIIEVLKKEPGVHGSRTLVFRVFGENPSVEQFRLLTLIFRRLVDEGVVVSMWMPMEKYIEEVLLKPDCPITVDELLKGTELSKEEWEKRTGRSAEREPIMHEIELLRKFKAYGRH